MVELPRYVYSPMEKENSVMISNRCMYGFKDAAKIWNRLLFKEFQSFILIEMKRAPCIFWRHGFFVICHVDDYIILKGEEKNLDSSEKRFRQIQSKESRRTKDFFWY